LEQWLVALTGEMINLGRLNIRKNPPERRAAGRRGSARGVHVLGAMDRPAVAAGTVAATTNHATQKLRKWLHVDES